MAIALLLCVAWVVVAPLIDHGMNWKFLLLTNVPTLATLFMVFVVQHTQNHHVDAIQVKLDELIRAMEGAKNSMMHVEELSPEALKQVKKNVQREAGE